MSHKCIIYSALKSLFSVCISSKILSPPTGTLCIKTSRNNLITWKSRVRKKRVRTCRNFSRLWTHELEVKVQVQDRVYFLNSLPILLNIWIFMIIIHHQSVHLRPLLDIPDSTCNVYLSFLDYRLLYLVPSFSTLSLESFCIFF